MPNENKNIDGLKPVNVLRFMATSDGGAPMIADQIAHATDFFNRFNNEPDVKRYQLTDLSEQINEQGKVIYIYEYDDHLLNRVRDAWNIYGPPDESILPNLDVVKRDNIHEVVEQLDAPVNNIDESQAQVEAPANEITYSDAIPGFDMPEDNTPDYLNESFNDETYQNETYQNETYQNETYQNAPEDVGYQNENYSSNDQSSTQYADKAQQVLDEFVPDFQELINKLVPDLEDLGEVPDVDNLTFEGQLLRSNMESSLTTYYSRFLDHLTYITKPQNAEHFEKLLTDFKQRTDITQISENVNNYIALQDKDAQIREDIYIYAQNVKDMDVQNQEEYVERNIQPYIEKLREQYRIENPDTTDQDIERFSQSRLPEIIEISDQQTTLRNRAEKDVLNKFSQFANDKALYSALQYVALRENIQNKYRVTIESLNNKMAQSINNIQNEYAYLNEPIQMDQSQQNNAYIEPEYDNAPSLDEPDELDDLLSEDDNTSAQYDDNTSTQYDEQYDPPEDNSYLNEDLSNNTTSDENIDQSSNNEETEQYEEDEVAGFGEIEDDEVAGFGEIEEDGHIQTSDNDEDVVEIEDDNSNQNMGAVVDLPSDYENDDEEEDDDDDVITDETVTVDELTSNNTKNKSLADLSDQRSNEVDTANDGTIKFDPSDVTPLDKEDEKEKTSKRKKIMIGVGIGLGAIVLAGVILMIALMLSGDAEEAPVDENNEVTQEENVTEYVEIGDPLRINHRNTQIDVEVVDLLKNGGVLVRQPSSDDPADNIELTPEHLEAYFGAQEEAEAPAETESEATSEEEETDENPDIQVEEDTEDTGE